MKSRRVTGTDIARIGAWDASRQAEILTKQRDREIQSDIAAGWLYSIRTGGDGSGATDVYIEEEPTETDLSGFRKVGTEHLLQVPGGKLLVGGAEDYRAAQPNFIGDKSIIEIPPGDYAIRCYFNPDEESSGGRPTEADLAAALGEEDHRYYRRANQRTQSGCLLVLLAPVVWYWRGWKWALAFTLVAGLGWLHVRDFWLKRDARYQAIQKKVADTWHVLSEKAPPVLILVLRKVSARAGLRGGDVEISH